MSEVSSLGSNPGALHTHEERVRALCQQHWLGIGATAEHRAAADLVRQGYFTTATERYKAAIRIYDLLTSTDRHTSELAPVLMHVSRNVQLLMAYQSLWEAFQHVYNAAAYTRFARAGAEREPLESERAKMARVLSPPFLPEAEVAKIVLLRNGETPGGAIQRLCSRRSREMVNIAGEAQEQTITAMDAFLQGTVQVSQDDAGNLVGERYEEVWVVRALDDAGRPLDLDTPLDAEKYRSVIRWLCYQIHRNINFVGKSDDPLDDAILVIRAFCLLDPVMSILLQESRKDLIFAL